LNGARQRDTRATIALIVAVLAVSWGAILVRLCDAPKLAIAFYRLLLSTLIVAPAGALAWRPLTRRAGWTAMAAGALLGLHFASWISSLSLTSVASSVMLVSTQPVFTAVLSPWLLGERAGRRGWAAVALALAGAGLLTGADLQFGPQALLGDGLALAGALTASLYLMLGRRVGVQIPFPQYVSLVYGSGAVALALLVALGGVALSGFPAASWLWIALIAVGPNVLGHSLLNWSVRRVPALVVNVATLGEPVLATFYAAWIFDERRAPAFYAGAGLIAAGIMLALGHPRSAPSSL